MGQTRTQANSDWKGLADAEAGRNAVSFLIHQCGMKAYPAVVYAQTAIVASLLVAREVGDLDGIAAIEIATSRRGYEQAGRDREKWSPKNRDTADHSLPYITARAIRWRHQQRKLCSGTAARSTCACLDEQDDCEGRPGIRRFGR